MFDMISDQNVPPRIMEMLKIFLAASSRGDQAVLILETRKGTITTNYRSVESLTENQSLPAPPHQEEGTHQPEPGDPGKDWMSSTGRC